MKVGVISLGCAKNLVDTENLLGILCAADLSVVKDITIADAVIINTCGFIESAKTEAIETILDVAQYKKQNLKKLIVMGCLSQRYKDDLEKELPEVDRFIAIREYNQIGAILSEVLGVKIPNTYGKAPRVLSDKPWMAYLRIADGCDNRCSYCAIPLIRGDLRSYEEEDIVSEAKRLVKEGVKELNLIAQDSSRYGYDLDGTLHLSSLLKKLDALEGVHWIRILYLYPDEIPDDLLDTIRQSKHILPYFDIPVQHGSNAMLKAMHRRGSKELILERCSYIRSRFELPALRTTLMCGFPGETEDDHRENLSLIQKAHFNHLGAFTYSKEEGTPSYDWDDDVPQEVKEARKEEVMKTQSEVAAADYQAWIGKTTEVLIEGYDALTRMYTGRNYFYAPDGVDGMIRVKTSQQHDFGTFINVRITKAIGQNLIGEEVQ